MKGHVTGKALHTNEPSLRSPLCPPGPLLFQSATERAEVSGWLEKLPEQERNSGITRSSSCPLGSCRPGVSSQEPQGQKSTDSWVTSALWNQNLQSKAWDPASAHPPALCSTRTSRGHGLGGRAVASAPASTARSGWGSNLNQEPAARSLSLGFLNTSYYCFYGMVFALKKLTVG